MTNAGDLQGRIPFSGKLPKELFCVTIGWSTQGAGDLAATPSPHPHPKEGGKRPTTKEDRLRGTRAGQCPIFRIPGKRATDTPLAQEKDLGGIAPSSLSSKKKRRRRRDPHPGEGWVPGTLRPSRHSPC